MFAKLATVAVAAAFVAVTAFAPMTADAQVPPKRTQIKGNVKQNTGVGQAVTIAGGKGNIAKARIGNIGGGSNIEGNVNQNTLVGRAGTFAFGKGNTARTNVGTIRGSDIEGNVDQNTVVYDVLTGASGEDNKAGTSIGGIGN